MNEHHHKKSKKSVYLSLIFDLTFKYIFGYEKNIRFTEYLLEILLKQEPGYFKGKLKIINSYNIVFIHNSPPCIFYCKKLFIFLFFTFFRF